jgi:tetratricopeptide (TPR) repeat protein
MGLLGTAYVQLLEFDKAESCLEEAMRLGQERNDNEAIGPACIGLMGMHCVRWVQNSAEEVQRYADMILNTDLANSMYYRTYSRFFVTWSKAIRGDFDISLAEGHETTEMGRRENYPGAIGFGLTAVAYNETFLENFEAAIAKADEGSRLSGGFVDKAICDGIKGLATALSGDGQGGLDLLQRIYDELTELEYYSMYNIVDMPIGVAMATLGDLSGGTKWIERAAEQNLSNGNTHGAGMSYNALGEIYMQIATGKEKPTLDVLRKNIGFLLRTIPFATTKAIQCFDKAAEIGTEYNMYGLAAMAYLNKGKALMVKKKRNEARAALQKAKDAMSNLEWKAMDEKVNAALAQL